MTLPLRKAMVLAAGFGKRLRPLTTYTAKPALPLMGRPLIDYILLRLANAGIREAVVNLHHQRESVERALSGAPAHLKLHRSVETELLGTAGGLKRAGCHFAGENAFLLMNGDTLVDFDLDALARTHHDSKAAATLLLRPRPRGTTYSSVTVDNEGHIESIGGARDNGELMFAGVWVLSASVLDRLSGAPAGLEKELLPPLIEEGVAVGCVQDAAWITIDTPQRYWAACLTMARERLFEEDWAVGVVPRRDPSDVYVGDDTRVDKRALCRGAVVLGAGCGVARGARIENIVGWDRVEIPSDARVENCVLTDGVALGPGAELVDKLVMRVGKDTSDIRRREIHGELVITKLKRERMRGL